MTDDERRWREDKDRYGWVLPPPAAWPLRLPLVRHVRAAVLRRRAYRWARMWSGIGLGLGSPNSRDLWIIYAIARGWC